MDQISISFENSAEKYFKAACQLQKAMPHMASTLLVTAMLFIILATISGALVAFHGNTDLTAPKGWGVIVVGMLSLMVLVLYNQRRHIMIQFRTSPASQGTMTYHIGPSGFTVTGDKFNTTYTWDGIIDVVRSKDFVLLFISESGAQYFPNDLVSEAEFDLICAWARKSA